MQNADPVGDVFDHAQVMGDKQICTVCLILNILHQVYNLGLNGDVQSGDALVCNDQLGIHNQRSRNSDTLTLSAGKLMGITRGVFRRESDLLKKLADQLCPFLTARDTMMNIKPFTDDVFDLFSRIQTCHRVLKDHLHIGAQHLAGFAVQFPADYLALKTDRAGRGIVETDDAPADGGLSGAGLADQTVGLAGVDLEGNAVDCPDRVGAGDRKMLGQVFNLQQCFTHGASPPLSARAPDGGAMIQASRSSGHRDAAARSRHNAFLRS